MRIQIYISVTALILIHKSTSEAVSRPSPPANVSIQCDSYGVEVRWEYPDLSQNVHFSVEVQDGDNIRKNDTTRHLSLNISSMLSTSLTNRYIVTVNAVREGQQSEPSKSDIFSYYVYAAIAKIKCYLDFPEVKLSPKDGKLHVQFINPLNLYKNTPALRDLNDDLKYTVETEEGLYKATCEKNTKTCETSIVFSKHRGDYCFNLTGEIEGRLFNLRRSCFTGDIRISVSRPSPPANVSIQCDSYGVEVRWEYPDLSQNVHFSVEVKDGDNIRKNDTTRHLSLNISSMLSTSLTNRYIVTVNAVREGQQSEPSQSDIFSYNVDAAIAKFKCYLDFPEVKLSPKDGKLHVQFINPLNLYKNTPALRDLNGYLKYTVETEEGLYKATCEKKTKTCETSIVFSKHRGDYCFNLTGEIERRLFNLRRSCFIGDIRIYTPFTVYLYPVLVCVLTLLSLTSIIMLLVMKYNSEIKKKAITMLPRFLPPQTHSCKLLKLDPEILVSDLHIEPDKEPEEQTVLLEVICPSDEKPASGDSDKDEGSGDSNTVSPYGANDLDEAEPDDSLDGYNCPHALGLEMSPGDMVKGYGR